MHGEMYANAEAASDAKAAANPPHFTASTTLAYEILRISCATFTMWSKLQCQLLKALL
jgi:hypothetical protein